MKCGYCGRNIKDNAKFCTYCGNNLREIQTDKQSAQKSKKGYISSLLTLLAIIIIICVGGWRLLNGGNQSTDVSASDSSAPSQDVKYYQIYEPLIGKWVCTDRAAADYRPSDYGIDVKIILEIKSDGKFALDYSMTDTGAPALKLELDGGCSVNNAKITFKPDLSKLGGETSGGYFKRHGNNPTFQYSVNDSTLTLTYENGTNIEFKRA